MKNKKVREGFRLIKKAIWFFISFDDYWQFKKIIKLENKYGVKSHFNFFAGNISPFRSLKKRLFDPGYNIYSPRLKKLIKQLDKKGWTIGLHQSFDSWEKSDDIFKEKNKIESILGAKVHGCRQHWLRFSWGKTWLAQGKAGLELDTTLGFNDIPGFRNSSAIQFNPWNFIEKKAIKLKAIPNIFMDSQFFNYKELPETKRNMEIKQWIDEIRFVHGEATIIWHQRVFSKDYDWSSSYEFILKQL